MFVYTSCDAHRTKQAICVSGAERLLQPLQALHESVQHTYLLSNLPVEDENLESTAAAVMASHVAGA